MIIEDHAFWVICWHGGMEMGWRGTIHWAENGQGEMVRSADIRTDRIARSRCRSFLGPDAVRPYRSASSLVGAACASIRQFQTCWEDDSVALCIRLEDMRPTRLYCNNRAHGETTCSDMVSEAGTDVRSW